MLTAVARRELEADGIAVSLVLPSITATEFGGGRYQPGEQPRPGVVAHSAEYVGQVVLRALRTGPAHLARIGAADVPRRDRPLPTARMSHRVAVGRSVVSSGGTAAMAARMASTNARADCAVSSTATRAEGPSAGFAKSMFRVCNAGVCIGWS